MHPRPEPSTPTTILQITPYFPPDHSGVGDAVAVVHRQLRELHAPSGDLGAVVAADPALSSVLVCHRNSVDASGWQAEGVSFVSPDARSVVKFVESMRNRAICLHYSGYGYASNGAPTWLAKAIEDIRKRLPDVCICTMFHELYATGMPWQRAFWWSPLQRRVAKRLARASHFAWGTTPTGCRWLNGVRGAGMSPVKHQAVWSNLGEPEVSVDHTTRQPFAVVFGGGGMARHLLLLNEGVVVARLRDLGIERIVQVGHVAGPFRSTSAMPVEEFGSRSPDSVSELLQSAAIGLLAYPIEYLDKSGIAGAYLAHHLPFLLLSDDGIRLMPWREDCKYPTHWSELATASFYAGVEYSETRHSHRFVRSLQFAINSGVGRGSVRV